MSKFIDGSVKETKLKLIKEMKLTNTEKLKRILNERIPDLNNYDDYDLSPPYEEMNLTKEEILSIEKWLNRILKKSAELAVSMVDDINEY